MDFVSFKKNNNVRGQYRVSSGSVGSNYGNAASAADSTGGVQNGMY